MDPLSITFAVAGIPGIFNSCIDCFDYIQLGRQFGKNYENSQLKLDLVKLRLTRWGESVHINVEDSEDVEDRVVFRSPEEAEKVVETLTAILDLFRDTEKVAKRCKLKKESNRADENTTDNTTSSLALRKKVPGLTIRRRQKETSLVRKVAWVLYEQKSLRRLLEDLTELITALEEIFPATQRQTQRFEAQAGELEGEPRVQELENACDEVDDAFQRAMLKAMVHRKGPQFDDFTVTEKAMVQNGDYISMGAIVAGQGNSYTGFNISGEARVRNGDNYGGKDIFDNI